MKLSEFIGLPEDHKRSVVMTQGVAVGRRELESHEIFLFQLYDFYVETFCCYKTQEILEYRVFQNTRQLTPYLAEIEISHLLN